MKTRPGARQSGTTIASDLVEDSYLTALREEKKRRQEIEEIREARRKILAEYREIAPTVAERIKSIMERLVDEQSQRLEGIANLSIVDESWDSPEGVVATGAVVYLVPVGSKSIEELISSSQGHGSPRDTGHIRRKQSTAEFRVVASESGGVSTSSYVDRSPDEKRRSKWEIDSPRQSAQSRFQRKIPLDDQTDELVRERFLRFLTWVLKDRPSLTPKHRWNAEFSEPM